MSTLGRIVQKGVVRSVDSGINLMMTPLRVATAIGKIRDRIAGRDPSAKADYHPPEWYQAYINVFNEVIKAHDRDHALGVVDVALADSHMVSYDEFYRMVSELREGILSGRQKFNGAITASAHKSEIELDEPIPHHAEV